MKVIFGTLSVCFLAFGTYTFIKNPGWMIDFEHMVAFGIGLGLGFILGELLY